MEIQRVSGVISASESDSIDDWNGYEQYQAGDFLPHYGTSQTSQATKF